MSFIYCLSGNGQNSKNSIVCIVPNSSLTNYLCTFGNYQKTIQFCLIKVTSVNEKWPCLAINRLAKKLNTKSDFYRIYSEFTVN